MSPAKLSRETSLYLLYHVFLPSKTPQKDDFSPEVGHAFFDMVIDSLEDFRTYDTGVATTVIDCMLDMFNNMKSVHDEATHDVIEGELRKALQNTFDKGWYRLIQPRQHIIT